MERPEKGFLRGESLSLVLPAYNEERNVEQTVEKCVNALKNLVDDYEIIIVDDGSTDKTGQIADQLAEKYKKLKVIHNPINLGVGISLLIGFKAAKYKLVTHNGMDYPFNINDLQRFLPLFKDADIVVAVRSDHSANPFYRKITSLTNYVLLRLLFNIKIGDLNFIQVYKKEILDKINVEARSPGFVTPEILIRAKDKGYRIKEVKAKFHQRTREIAKCGAPHAILQTIYDMLRFWLKRAFGKRSI